MFVKLKCYDVQINEYINLSAGRLSKYILINLYTHSENVARIVHFICLYQFIVNVSYVVVKIKLVTILKLTHLFMTIAVWTV